MSTPSDNTSMPKSICIFSGYVAGVSHYCKEPTAIDPQHENFSLVLEPHNTYDVNAIKVHAAIVGKLGYLPSESTFAVHNAIAQLPESKPFVTLVATSDKRYKEILIRVWINIEN